MEKRKLGQQGLEVSALGLGCMGMSFGYGPAADEAESIKVLHHALELGVNFWDTAEVYGPHTNETLLGRALKGKDRSKIILATKFGFAWGEDGKINGLDSSPKNIQHALEGSLKRLGTDYIDLYYQHRLDPTQPIEDTMTVLEGLVKAGKIRYLGLSEVGPGTIRRAHAVHPLTAIQSEYSLWDRGVELKVLPTLRELGIGFVPFSPIGRGFLTGKLKTVEHLDKTDFRTMLPRFQAGNMEHNIKLVEMIEKLAAENKITAAQLALAWLLKQGKDIVPIPGTRRIKYLDENAGAINVQVPDKVWEEIDTFYTNFKIEGVRYPEAMLKMIDNTD